MDVTEFRRKDGVFTCVSFDARQLRATYAPFDSAEKAYHKQLAEMTLSILQRASMGSSAFHSTEGPHNSHRDDEQRGPVRHWPANLGHQARSSSLVGGNSAFRRSAERGSHSTLWPSAFTGDVVPCRPRPLARGRRTWQVSELLLETNTCDVPTPPAQVICGIPAVQCSADVHVTEFQGILYLAHAFTKCVPGTRRHRGGEGLLCTMVGGRNHQVVFQPALITAKRASHHVKCIASRLDAAVFATAQTQRTILFHAAGVIAKCSEPIMFATFSVSVMNVALQRKMPEVKLMTLKRDLGEWLSSPRCSASPPHVINDLT